MNERRTSVLHLRASAGSGGGPEKTLFKTARIIDSSRFRYAVLYMKKRRENLSCLSELYLGSRLEYYEVSGGAVDPLLLHRCGGIVRRTGADIVHAHDPKTIVYAWLLHRQFPNTRLVATLHGWVPRRTRSSLYAALCFRLLPRYEAVVTVSRELERATLARGIKNVRLIHNAIDLDEWQRKIRPEEKERDAFTVGFVGRLSREKGVFQFIDTAAAILDEDPSVRFVVVGEGPLHSEAVARADALGIRASIHFKGQVSQKEMPEMYARLGALLSPSHTEGLPNNLLEACAMGVPVVATRVGGVEELIRDGVTGLLAEDGDVQHLALHVLSLRRDVEMREKLAENARRNVTDKFSFVERVVRLQELYRSLGKNDF